MPLRGLRRSPLTRPRKDRRDSSASRSSCARKSAESSSCPREAMGTGLLLVQRLEVLLDLALVVARHLLAGNGLFHHLAVLAHDPEVLEARGRVRPLAHQVGVHAFLAARPRLALHAYVEGIRAQALGGIALRVAALPLAGEEPLALGEVTLVTGSSRLALTPLIPPLGAAPLVLAPPAQPLPVGAPLLHGAELVQGALHGIHGLVVLALLERLHPLADLAAPGVLRAALAAELFHFVEQLAHLVGRELIAAHGAAQLLGPLEHRLALGLGEVALEVGEPVHLLEHPDPFVALLEEGVEVGALVAQRGVLEHGGKIAGLGGTAAALSRRDGPLLHV